MATAHPCRKGRHNYEAIAGAIAGLGRRTCVTCGSVQIDLRPQRTKRREQSCRLRRQAPNPVLGSPGCRTPRRSTVSAGFGVRAARQPLKGAAPVAG